MFCWLLHSVVREDKTYLMSILKARHSEAYIGIGKVGLMSKLVHTWFCIVQKLRMVFTSLLNGYGNWEARKEEKDMRSYVVYKTYSDSL